MTGHMEDWLDRPLREVLPALQSRVLGGRWRGVPTWKWPCDAWTYAELIWDLKPAAIVEIGNKFGGSTLFLADMLRLVNQNRGRPAIRRVVGVDVNHDRLSAAARMDPCILLVTGPACDAATVDLVARHVLGAARPGEPVLVIEDSAHTFENTLGVLRAYSPLVTPGSYFVVEDGIMGHGLERDMGEQGGPLEAVDAFLAEEAGKDFELDRDREWPITWNPKGYLRRKA